MIFAKSSEENIPFIWIGSATPSFWNDDVRRERTPFIGVLRLDNKAAVDDFYHAALDNGGTCHGEPGPRGDDYYAASCN